MAQSTSDRDVVLRREQIMQARSLWENTPSEEVSRLVYDFRRADFGLKSYCIRRRWGAEVARILGGGIQ